ncbi:MAG: hypothetical protein UIM53_05720 [Acutalibacteraceae bacterium]|nr:hypothetical protein [Acutalibacteraceae bacterium]
MNETIEIVNNFFDKTENRLDKQSEEMSKLFDSVPASVNKWLNEHPEVTTTLQDGEIILDKFHRSILSVLHNGYYSTAGSGVVGDGVADDTLNLQGLINSTKSGDTLLIPSDMVCKITDTITVHKNINFLCLGTLIYCGVKDRPALHIKGVSNKKIMVASVRDEEVGTWHGWDVEDYAGIKFENLWHCEVKVGSVFNFTTGVQFVASGGLNGGFCNNLFDIFTLQNNQIGLDLIGDGVQSWINANIINNMWVSYTATSDAFYTADKERYGIRETFKNGCEFPHDTNIFNGVKFDLYKLSGGSFTSIALSRAKYWVFNDYRLELIGDNVRFCDIDMQYNAVEGITFTPIAELRGAMNNVTVNVSNYGASSYAYPKIFEITRGIQQLEYRLLEAHNFAGKQRTYAPSFTCIEDWFALVSTEATIKENTYVYTGVNEPHYAQLYENVRYFKGVKAGDTIRCRMNEAVEGSCFMWVKCYDADGNVIKSQCVSGNGFYWDSSTNTYKNTHNLNDCMFTAFKDCETVAVLFFGKATALSIYTTGEAVSVLKSLDASRNKSGRCYAQSVPSIVDNFEVGDVLLNATSTECYGWELTVNDNVKSWTQI